MGQGPYNLGTISPERSTLRNPEDGLPRSTASHHLDSPSDVETHDPGPHREQNALPPSPRNVRVDREGGGEQWVDEPVGSV